MWPIPVTWEPFTIEATVSSHTASYFTWAVTGHVTPLHTASVPTPLLLPILIHPTGCTVSWQHLHLSHSQLCKLAQGKKPVELCNLQTPILYGEFCRKTSREGDNFFLILFVKIFISLLKLSGRKFLSCWSSLPSNPAGLTTEYVDQQDIPLSSVTANHPVSYPKFTLAWGRVRLFCRALALGFSSELWLLLSSKLTISSPLINILCETISITFSCLLCVSRRENLVLYIVSYIS